MIEYCVCHKDLSFEVSQTIEKTEGPFYCEKWGREEMNFRTMVERGLGEVLSNSHVDTKSSLQSSG